MRPDCYACRLTEGLEPLPGGRVRATKYRVVEHCTGPLGVGTLIVKPFRHCVHAADLTLAEAQEVGPLLQRVSQVVQTVTEGGPSVHLRVVKCRFAASAYPFRRATRLEWLEREIRPSWSFRAGGNVSGW